MEHEIDLGATSPVRIYKANGERLIPPEEEVAAKALDMALNVDEKQ